MATTQYCWVDSRQKQTKTQTLKQKQGIVMVSAVVKVTGVFTG